MPCRRLQFVLLDSEDEYSSVVLSDVQQSADVVEGEAGRSVEAVVGADEFVRVHLQHGSEHLDAVIATVSDPDALGRVDDQCPRFVE